MKLCTLRRSFPVGPAGEVLSGHVEYLLPDVMIDHFTLDCEMMIESVRDLPEEFAHRRFDWQKVLSGEQKPGSLLLVRHGGFGDLLMITPLIEQIKKRLPDCRIDFGAAVQYGSVMSNNPNVSRVWPTSYVPFNDLRRYDCWGWFDKTIERNEFTENAGVEIFGRCLGFKEDEIESRVPVYNLHPQYAKDAAECFAKLPKADRRIGIQVFGSAPQRAWPLHNVISLVGSLVSLPGTQAFLFGLLPPQFTGYEEYRRAMVAMPNAYDFLNHSPDMEQSVAMMAQCDLVICPDSAMYHYAAALGIPSIPIFGPFPKWARTVGYPDCHPIEFGDEEGARLYGERKMDCQPCFQHAGHPCLSSAREDARDWSECMRRITAERVMRKALEVLVRHKIEWPREMQQFHTVFDGVLSELGCDPFDYRHNQQMLSKKIDQWIHPENHLEVSPTVKERSVRIGIIHGNSDHNLLQTQLEHMVKSGTFDGFKAVDLTIVDNGVNYVGPKALKIDDREIPVTTLHTESNEFPPLPYNDLMVYWAHQPPADEYVIMDDDLLDFKPQWLPKLLTLAKTRKIDCWAPEFCWVPMAQETIPSLGRAPAFATALFGFNWAVFERVGMFDERDYCWHGFDSDYIARVTLAGLRVGVLPGTLKIARHVGHEASKKRGLRHHFFATLSNKRHHQRWRVVAPPLPARIDITEIKVRQFIGVTPGELKVIRGEIPPVQRTRRQTRVVIPTWNNSKGLVRAIRSVKGEADEIIVVDNGSTDDTMQEIFRLTGTANIKVIHNNDNHGFSQAVNQGIAQCGQVGADIFLMNDDIEMEPGALNRLSWALEKSDKVGLASALHLHPFTLEDECLHPATAPNMRYDGQSIQPMDWCGFCAVLIRADVIKDVGLLDAVRFPHYSSDKDYCHRAAEKGWETVAVTTARAIHHGSVATAKLSQSDPARFKEWADKRLENPEYVDAIRRKEEPKPELRIVKADEDGEPEEVKEGSSA